MSPVRHGPRKFKQMALEVATRNPERLEGILQTLSKFKGDVLNEANILKIYAQLYLDGAVVSRNLDLQSMSVSDIKAYIKDHNTHNNEWGYPTGYQAAFTRYLKTLSEFGFIYSQYNEPLRISPVGQAVLSGVITLSEAFALQSIRFWRKSPYRRVLNDFNYFKFIVDVIRAREDAGHMLSYPQLMLSLFSEDGDVEGFIQLLESYRIGNSLDSTYELAKQLYSKEDGNHAKIANQHSCFNDYGDSVFRVLQLTGFISVQYQGIMMLTTNSVRMDMYRDLVNMHFTLPETAKEDYFEYFEVLGSITPDIIQCIHSHRDEQAASVDRYNYKLDQIVQAYNLTEEFLADYLDEVSQGAEDRRVFRFIQVPLKFEFLLSLYMYVCLGDEYTYKPNYLCDDAGIPYSHAPGNVGDIEVFNFERYWLIEVTLIRNRTQQINNETINLFRHIDSNHYGAKYMSLVAPVIHEDTELLIKVATVIAMQERSTILYSKPYTTTSFIENMKSRNCIIDMQESTMQFISNMGQFLSRISKDSRIISES
ncbi:MAG: AlwI family type II restriction endonuclease [bacterium]|nr:AlwI family type II restriction endonuclease [bacterium]